MARILPVMILVVVALFLLSGISSSGSLAAVNNRDTQVASIQISANSTETPVKHVVNIFLENHSFDNMFGIYPAMKINGTLSVEKNLTVPLNLVGHPSAMKNLTAVPNGSFETSNPIEGWIPYHQDWNKGAMNGFMKGSGPQSLTYYSASQMAPEWALAQQYGLADNYYAQQITESTPNHLYYLAGYTPVFNDYGPPPYVPFSESMMGELQHYNLSWAFYIQNPSSTFMDWKFFSGINSYSSHLKGWNDFSGEVQNGTLPSVSWLFSQGPGNYSQGAPSNILNGELWLLHVVDMIESSPVWNSTAIFITYDEFGGYYDQVAPPVFHGIQLGFRIPLIVVSPYAKEDYVSHTLLTHTSLLAFIDYNWKMPALNRIVSESNIPIDFFDFNSSYGSSGVARSPISFSGAYGFPVPDTMFFKLTHQMLTFDYSSSFPVQPQIPFNQLPYGRTGGSALNLSASGGQVFVAHDTAYTPFYQSYYFLIAIVVAEVAIATAAGFKFRRRTNE